MRRAVLLSVLITTAASGAVRSTTTAPVAVRGGVLLLPLEPGAPRGGWSATAVVEAEDGREIVGAIGWIHAAPLRGRSGWTDDPRRAAIRPIRPDDGGDGRPCLLLRLPDDVSGALRLGRQRLEPAWCDAPPADLPSAPAMPPPAARRHDRPDPSSPFEFWRRVLLAERLGAPAPRPPWPDDDLRALLADHHAALWRVGLHRLRAIDAPAAVECRSRLTQIADDRGVAFAAWVSDPSRTAALLASLLDRRSSDAMVAGAARRWLETLDPLLIWIESPGGARTRLAVVNRTERTFVGRFTWPGREEIPIAEEFRPETLETVIIDRPIAADRPRSFVPGADRDPEMLAIEVDGRAYEIAVGPPSTVANPPGAFVHALRPPVTLAEVEMRSVQPIEEARTAFVNLRRRFGRWEVFFECRRPAGTGDAGPPAPGVLNLPRHDAVIAIPGEDTVQLLLGPPPGAAVEGIQLVVPERGGFQLRHGPEGGAVQVFRRSLPDRWYCRIVLPPAWLPEESAPLLIGCARTVGADRGFQIAPGVTTPWRRVIGHTAVRLDQWNGLPQPATP